MVNCSNFISGVACSVLMMSTISKIFGCGLPTICFNQECWPSTCTLIARLKFKYAPYNIAVRFIEVDLMGVDLVGS